MLFFYVRIPIAGGDSDAAEEVSIFIGMKLRHFVFCRRLCTLQEEKLTCRYRSGLSAIDKMNGNIQAGAGALTHISIFLCRP